MVTRPRLTSTIHRSILIIAILTCAAACGDSPDEIGVTVTVEPAGANCPSGGQRLDVSQGGVVTTAFVYNASGTSTSISVADEPAGANCANGGKAITTTVGDSAPVTS